MEYGGSFRLKKIGEVGAETDCGENKTKAGEGALGGKLYEWKGSTYEFVVINRTM